MFDVSLASGTTGFNTSLSGGVPPATPRRIFNI